MTPDRWQRLKLLFDAAIKLEPSARDEFVARECADDPDLRNQLNILLSAHLEAATFIEQPAAEKIADLILHDQKSPNANLTKSQAETIVQPVAEPTTSVPQSVNTKHPFFWIILGLSAIEILLFVLAGICIYRYGTLDRPMGWQATEGRNGWVISAVDPQGVADGKLQVGDQLVALNGDVRVNRIGHRLKSRSIKPGDSYTLRIRRGNTEEQFQLTRPVERRSTQHLGYIFSVLFVGILFLAVGILIGVVRPDKRVTQVFALAMMATALVLLSRSLDPIKIYLRGNEVILAFLINCIDPAHLGITYHAFGLFPSGALKGRLWSWFKYLVYFLGVSLALVWLWIGWPVIDDELRMDRVFNLHAANATVLKFHLTFLVVSSIAGCAVLIRNYRVVREPDQKRRIKWLIYALLAAILPVTLFFITIAIGVGAGFVFLSSRNTPLRAWWWFSLLAIGVLPITLGYAILTRRVSDVHIIVRQGLQYLLARNVLRILLALPIVALIYAVIAQRNLSIASILSQNPFLVLVIIAAALGLVFQRQLSRAIDRRFFREAYNQEQILLRLIDSVKGKDSLAEISRLVTDEVAVALHPMRIHLFFRKDDDGDFRLGYTSEGSNPNPTLPGDFRLVRFMEDHGGALDFPFPPKNNLPRSEKLWLAETGAALIVPMLGSEGHLAGLLVLGEKKSEEPYSTTDRRLLETIATQIALVCENIRLRERVATGSKRTLGKVKQIEEGKYVLERLIGEGGMGKVYLARDTQLDRPVALKFLPAELADDEKRLNRFFREAKAASALNHPNIITVYEVGQLDEQHFIATEFVNGETLRQRMAKDQMRLSESLDIATQIASALSAAHFAGIIHRDIKPENVMIRPDGYVKVLDFGLAKLTTTPNISAEDPTRHMSQTDAGIIMGTARYMSPEQARGNPVDARTDVWSLGVVIYEMVTGIHPFTARSISDILAMVLTAEPPLLSSSIVDSPDSLQQLLTKALSKDVNRRYETVNELLADLAQVKSELAHH
jgi:eukaryotic-like serine/threonine-protein kinase